VGKTEKRGGPTERYDGDPRKGKTAHLFNGNKRDEEGSRGKVNTQKFNEKVNKGKKKGKKKRGGMRGEWKGETIGGVPGHSNEGRGKKKAKWPKGGRGNGGEKKDRALGRESLGVVRLQRGEPRKKKKDKKEGGG